MPAVGFDRKFVNPSKQDRTLVLSRRERFGFTMNGKHPVSHHITQELKPISSWRYFVSVEH